MRTFMHLGTWVMLGLLVPSALAAFSAKRESGRVIAAGDHFRVTVDVSQGGEIVDIQLFDGSAWNRILGGDGQTCPMVKISHQGADYALAHDRKARVEHFEAHSDMARFQIRGVPSTAEGGPSPWTVSLTYEIYAEGAVFVDLDYCLSQGDAVLTAASVSLALDRAVTQWAKYHDSSGTHLTPAFESARAAFGTNPLKSYTNEIQALVEYKAPLAGSVAFQKAPGRFTWSLAQGGPRIAGPYRYRNRLALALGAAACGKPRSNVVGQRVYHWVNWFDYLRTKDTPAWYPTSQQIDKMAAGRGTMLILHHYWMLRAGSNGRPHADYTVPRDHEALSRTIAYAHRKGMRVGLYMRGIERYGPAAGFFEKYCRRDWDGLYVDWHGPHAVAHHEQHERPDRALNDVHCSADGKDLPGREYFLFTRRLRQIVGRGGFLIGHHGFGNAGILSNMAFDAYLPGELATDHDMFADRDTAAYKGMTGGGVCMPWTPDAPLSRTPEGVAKMAAWGFYPHICLGVQRRRDRALFPLEPDDPRNTFIQPYWRVLAAIDVERATLYNAPSQNVTAARCSDPSFHCVVYKEDPDAYLLIVANLGVQAGQAAITLVPKVLGMSGDYQLSRVDPQSGVVTPRGSTSAKVTTSTLSPWALEGWKLTKPRAATMPCSAAGATAADLYLRYTSSASHGSAIYLRLEREDAAGKGQLVGYLARGGMTPAKPGKDLWLQPGQATSWLSQPGPGPRQTHRFLLTCLCSGGPASSFYAILDVAPEPSDRAVVGFLGDRHSVELPSPGPTFRFAISADAEGRFKLELPPSPVEQWLAEPDVPPGPPGRPCAVTQDLISRKRILLGACGSRIDFRQSGAPLHSKMKELADFYRTFRLNFIYNFYPHDLDPSSGDWPALCRNIRAWQAQLNEAGIATSQSVVGRWLGEQAYRHPEKRQISQSGRSATGALCPRQSELARQVVAKLVRNVPADGFHVEEPGTGMCYCDRCQAEFRRYLAAERSRRPEELTFAEPLETLRAPTQEERFTRRDVWWHWFWFTLRSYRDYYGSLFDAARTAATTTWNKPCLTMTSIGYSGVVLPMAGARHTDFLTHPGVSGMLNALYWHCGEKVTVDSFKDYHLQTAWCKGQSLGKPVWFYIVTKSTKGRVEPWWFEAEVYDSLLAGLDGFILWPPLAERDAEVFPGIRRAFGFVADHEDCLAGAESCSQAAIAYNYDQTTYELFGTRYQAERSHPHFTEHFRAMFHVLSDLHVPADYIVALTRENLRRYRLLVLDELRSMTQQEAAAVRQWVADGGSLLAMGDTSGSDLYEQPRSAYPLGDVFGVQAKSRKLQAAAQLELIAGPEVAKAPAVGKFDYGSDVFIYWRFKYKHVADGYAIEPRPEANRLARWSDGSAAMVANQFGKGRCVYSGAFLQFCPAPQRAQVAKTLIGWLLRGDLPVICDGLPPEGDVNVLRKGNRLLVHLLNLKRWRLAGDPHSPTELAQWTIERHEPLEDLAVTVALPAGLLPARARIVSPDFPDSRPIDLQIRGRKASFVVPRLDLYDLVILEP